MTNVNQKRLVNNFKKLVSIYSPSGQEKEIASYLIELLNKKKLKTKTDTYGNIIAFLDGSIKDDPLLLACHMDTVEPSRNITSVIKEDQIQSNGETILGADDKAGIAIVLELIDYLQENQIKHRSLEFVFTREEEIGLHGAFNLDYSLLKAKEGLVLDGQGDLGGINLASPFLYSIKIEIIGKASHAGAAPEKGINAIKIAADAIAELKIGRIDEETTNNIGIITGGTASNVVPDRVLIKAEARSHDRNKVVKEVEKIKKAYTNQAKAQKGKILFKSSKGCDGYKYKKNDPFIESLANSLESIGVKPFFTKSGGASDANVFVRNNIKATIINIGKFEGHSKEESVKISGMVGTIRFLAELIEREQ